MGRVRKKAPLVLTMLVRIKGLALLGGLAVSAGLLTSVSSAAVPIGCPNTSLRVGASAGLPDCRAYEQVSPANKAGFAAYPAQGTLAQVSSSGEGLAYLGYQAFPGAAGNTALFAAHVSARSPNGWHTEEWTPGLPKAEVLKSYKVDYDFSDDLSRAILKVPLVPLTPEATPNVYNLFLRHPDANDPLGYSYSLINKASPALSAEQICGSGELLHCFEFVDVSTYSGGSKDFDRVMFESNAQLTPEAPATLFTQSLYESSGGSVKLVGILPDGRPANGSTAGAGSSIFYSNTAQAVERRIEHAMSRDGTRIIFEAKADGGEPDPAQTEETIQVYDRLNGSETIELSAPAVGAPPKVTTPESATFWAASTDGSRVFFTSAAELTTASSTGSANNSEDLYEYNVDTRTLSDRSVDTNPQDAASGAMVRGVIGASSDGAYVYFVADGQLVEGEGIDGQPNLYMVHDGEVPVFIATLSSVGSCNFLSNMSADACNWTTFSAQLEAYITPDGRHMAFMSTMNIPTVSFPGGYDNVDQATGESNSEVYEFAAPTIGETQGQLMCASCDPGGAPPVGNALIGGIVNAAVVPEPGVLNYKGISTPYYRVRAVSDDGGRVFYTAPASAAEPYEQVREWEASGGGSCSSTGGCQYVLAGSSGESSSFLGASPSGSDVFIASSQRLTSSDLDDVRDIYDVRVDGGFPTPDAELVCEHDCHSTNSAPPTQTAASSATGPSGNLASPQVAKRPVVKRKCGKRYRRSHGKCVRRKKRSRGPARNHARLKATRRTR